MLNQTSINNAQWNELIEAIEQSTGTNPPASNVTFDNTTSGYTAANVQDAIDESADKISELNQSLSYKYGMIDDGSVNVDELTNVGRYWINTSVASGTHPSGAYYYTLNCLGAGQIAISSDNVAYYRMFVNNAWTTWQELVTNQSLSTSVISLTTGATLYRYGKIRILRLNGATYSALKNVVLNALDIPPDRYLTIIQASTYPSLLVVNNNGVIEGTYRATYGGSAIAIPDAASVFGTLSWVVN